MDVAGLNAEYNDPLSFTKSIFEERLWFCRQRWDVAYIWRLFANWAVAKVEVRIHQLYTRIFAVELINRSIEN